MSLADLTTEQFIAATIASVCLFMIVLQALVRRAVWSGYLIGFFVAAIWLAVTFR